MKLNISLTQSPVNTRYLSVLFCTSGGK